jgi:hypothetical protein
VIFEDVVVAKNQKDLKTEIFSLLLWSPQAVQDEMSDGTYPNPRKAPIHVDVCHALLKV